MSTMRRTSFAAVVTVAALSACSSRIEEKPVNQTPAMAGTAIPPIDRDLPPRLETATFAVG